MAKGDVYRLRRDPKTQGHEQAGERYAIVALASRYAHLSSWFIVPTSTKAQPYIFRPQIEIPDLGPTLAMCDMARSIDPEKRLGAQVGFLSTGDMQQIDYALKQLLDLP